MIFLEQADSVKAYLQQFPKMPCNKCLVQSMCLRLNNFSDVVVRKECSTIIEYLKIENEHTGDTITVMEEFLEKYSDIPCKNCLVQSMCLRINFMGYVLSKDCLILTTYFNNIREDF